MAVINLPERKLVQWCDLPDSYLERFTTASIVIQLDEKLVIAPLCISKIAKARPNSAEWPECTSVQSSSP